LLDIGSKCFWYILLGFFFREFEPIRLLGLQLLGKLLVGIPSEKKVAKLFTLPTGQYRLISENLRKEITSAPRLFFCVISERLLKFPPSDNLSAIFFDVLGGASPKKVILPTTRHVIFIILLSIKNCKFDLLFFSYRS
jgi:hypothetical protein